jgi:hypothetical protein
MTNIKLNIPKPCDQGWSNMTPSDNGRFCSSCQKNVIDFTNFSDNELINYLNKNKSVCGRITENQLNRELVATRKKPVYFNLLTTTVLTFLGFNSNVFSQAVPKTEQLEIKNLEQTNLVNNNLVTGKVTNEHGLIEGVTVKIVGTDKATVTDSNGEYKIIAKYGDILKASYNEYVSNTMIVQNSPAVINFNLTSKESIMIEGFMISCKKRTFLGRIFHNIGDWFR